jgi:uncharacterized protein YaiE (UPF0345 family)
MSNSTSPISEAISHNVYFDGKVQSLGLETEQGKATLGVMKKGNYEFSASTPERMVIISGVMNVKLQDASWMKYLEHEEFNVKANTTFDIICDTDVAYICYYG